MLMAFPLVGNTFKSGSKSFEKDKLNTFKPLKTDITTNKASVPTIIPNDAIPVIIFIAFQKYFIDGIMGGAVKG